MTETGNAMGLSEAPVYTGYGDLGQTTFGDTGEISKSDLRLAAYGACEEANAAVGVAMSLGGLPGPVLASLASVQDDLFDLATDLTSPKTQPPEPVVRITAAHVERLDRACDHYAAGLTQVEGFVLPGGTAAAALLFQARTHVRRAERAAWNAYEKYDGAVNPLTARYLNRLSSMLFLIARGANAEHGDTMWRPGASVATPTTQQPADQSA